MVESLRFPYAHVATAHSRTVAWIEHMGIFLAIKKALGVCHE